MPTFREIDRQIGALVGRPFEAALKFQPAVIGLPPLSCASTSPSAPPSVPRWIWASTRQLRRSTDRRRSPLSPSRSPSSRYRRCRHRCPGNVPIASLIMITLTPITTPKKRDHMASTLRRSAVFQKRRACTSRRTPARPTVPRNCQSRSRLASPISVTWNFTGIDFAGLSSAGV